MENYLINPNHRIAVINKDLYGHFSEHLGRCIYEGLFVGRNSDIPNVNGMRSDVVNALKDMGIPVLRWPGGCFADEYHWKDGVGPLAARKKMINTHWGGGVEDNSFGTHEFQELIAQLGCDCYIAGNVGSGTVQEMSEWVEYMTFPGQSPMSELRRQNGREAPWRVKYFGVGNENWGCGGNMDPAFYANTFKRYATYVRQYDPQNNWIYKVACGPNGEDYRWTEELMRIAGWHMNGLALHYYTVTHDWSHKGSATEFSEAEYYTTLRKAYHIDRIINRHLEIMNRYDPDHHVDLIVDEWGTWYDVEPGTNPGYLYQQNTMRDAVVAGLTLNIFNKHADSIRMANIAQTVNVLQSVALTDGPELVLTPTYYVFKMYKTHQQNTLLGSHITAPQIGSADDKLPQLIESASVNEAGEICATVTNTAADKAAEIRCQVAATAVAQVTAEILTGAIDDYNSFGQKQTVETKPFDDFRLTDDGFVATLPACSVVKFNITPSRG
ncbi:MAG: alpha-N-arabinofuranosidase [Clostridia bacterium]|nr:alpha-N-arabinofuranosidase [Clostridia bacterium]